MNLSEDFAVPICWARVKPEQRVSGAAALALLVAAAADARTYTVRLNLNDAATWLSVHYNTARDWWDELVRKGWILEAKRQPRGVTGTLGPMFKRARADENVVAAVYRRVFGYRPGSDERRIMLEMVGTSQPRLVLWKRVCEEWYKAQHNPRDTVGMLDRFGKLAKLQESSERVEPEKKGESPSRSWNKGE